MHIILINLARAAERREKMQRQFDALGLDFEILEATDGRTLTEEQRALVDNRKRRRITPYPLSDNEIGCWISHRRAMATMLMRKLPMAVILEDDAELTPDFPHVLAALEKLGRPFDVIDLHRNFRRDEIFAPCRPLLPDNQLGRIGYTHMNLTAYVMSRKGAEKFLSQAPRFAHAVDKELHRYWANGLDIYGLEKPVAAQNDGGHSYIDEDRLQNRPEDRPRYPGADALYWKIMRWWSKFSDSVGKRICFPGYVRKGQRTMGYESGVQTTR
ncbi:MAG: glycosyltransferase family 25 protein [Alphaproteobacteria bacterium]